MIVTLPCGHTIDDEYVSTTCYGEGVREDVAVPRGHYPINAGPSVYCKHCDLYRPCPCDKRTTG